MPIIELSPYQSPLWMPGRHAQTILPALFRKVDGLVYHRERIATDDGDFLDIDWSRVGGVKAAILSHGLEGNSHQPYMMGMAQALNQVGWDVAAWNFRSCSGEMNNKVRFYHAGSTEDLDCVLQHIRRKYSYQEIAMIGFSLGGCQTLRLLGEYGTQAPHEVSSAIVFSAPCNLRACILQLSSRRFHKVVYLRRFIVTLKSKLAHKMIQFPDLLSHIDLDKIQRFEDFDTYFTAPMCGFRDAWDYYDSCSANRVIPAIRIPTLLVNARNDPFLHEECHPYKECKESRWVWFEQPRAGGHVGFALDTLHGLYWSEKRAIAFLEEAQRR